MIIHFGEDRTDNTPYLATGITVYGGLSNYTGRTVYMDVPASHLPDGLYSCQSNLGTVLLGYVQGDTVGLTRRRGHVVNVGEESPTDLIRKSYEGTFYEKWRYKPDMKTETTVPVRTPAFFREMNKFVEGKYVCPPWLGCETCIESQPGIAFKMLPRIDEHLAHVSTQSKLMLAYYKTDTQLERGVPVQIKPGRYLKLYYPHLSDEVIGQYSALFKLCADKKPDTIKIALTEEEIEQVYLRGPRSCMSHGLGSGSFICTKFHPTRAYAGGDLGVAYVEKTDGIPAARALISVEKKLYSKVYGDGGSFNAKLVRLLEKEGYKPGKLYGSRFPAKRPPANILRSYPNAYYAPFVDNIERLRLSEDKQFLILAETGQFPANNQKGLAIGEIRQCVECAQNFGYDPEPNWTPLMHKLCPDHRLTAIGECDIHKGETLKSKLQNARTKEGAVIKACLQCVRDTGLVAKCVECQHVCTKDAVKKTTKDRFLCNVCEAEKKDTFPGVCKECHLIMETGDAHKKIKDTCTHCGWLVEKRKEMEERGIEIDPEHIKIAQQRKINPIDFHIALVKCREAAERVYKTTRSA